MDLVWILTGGDYDFHSGEIKNYNLVEFDVLKRSIKLSDVSRQVYVVRPEIEMDNVLRKEIRDKIASGISFLCKNETYCNGKREYCFGYYFINLEGQLEIKPLHNYRKMYDQFINLVLDNCVYI
jgi:hypothetical protein